MTTETPETKRRKRKYRGIVLGTPVAIVLVLGAALGLMTIKPTATHAAAPLTPAAAAMQGLLMPYAPVTRPPTALRYAHTVASIPVLAYHQVDAGCSIEVLVCNAPGNPETVSRNQFRQELAFLQTQGYASVTAAEYVAWATDKSPKLPMHPILITFDDGTINSYLDTSDLLEEYGFTAVTFAVTQFADGAQAKQAAYVGWFASWTQLKSLWTDTWSFAFHAGAQGHTIPYGSVNSCQYFYPCQQPGESDAKYQTRVKNEIAAGRADLAKNLPGSRVNTDMWAVPFDDVGLNPGKVVLGLEPNGWLAKWAKTQFQVVFVQDDTHNGNLNERYRLEVEGTWSEAQFEKNFFGNIANNFFTRVHKAPAAKGTV